MGEFDGVELTDLVLTGPRLTLRPWQPGDAEFVFEAMQDPSVPRYLGHVPVPYRREDAAEFLTGWAVQGRADGTGVSCAVLDSATGSLVGDGFLGLRTASTGEVGYWVAPGSQGNGYAAETVDVLARWGFEHGLIRVELLCDPTNLGSAATALKAGFAFEGYRRGAYDLRGALRDDAVFARLATDPGEPIAPTFAAFPGASDGVVRLRVLAPADAPGSLEAYDEVAAGWSFTGQPWTAAQVATRCDRAGLERMVGAAMAVAVLDEASGQFAGEVSVRQAGPPGVGGIGYGVHPAFRGRGYTARALRLLAPWAFGPGGFNRLELGAKADNVASQRAALAAGFAPDGVRRGRLRNADGSYADEVRFALVRGVRLRTS